MATTKDITNALSSVFVDHVVAKSDNCDDNPVARINELFQDKPLLDKYKLETAYTFSYQTDNFALRDKRFLVCMFGRRDGIKYQFRACSYSKSLAEIEVATKFISWINKLNKTTLADAQMDSTESTEQGPQNLEGEKNINTILTRDVPTTSTIHPITTLDTRNLLVSMSSGEPPMSFSGLTDRWIKIQDFEITTGNLINAVVFNLDLPFDIYRVINVSNKLLFNQFVFNRPNIQVKIKINGHKFCQGKLVASYYYQPQTLGSYSSSTTNKWIDFQQAIQRDHVFLDLNESNEVHLEIPFESTNTYVTSLYDTDVDHYGASYARAHLTVVSPLLVPDESVRSIPGTVFVKLAGTTFTAMRRFKDVTPSTTYRRRYVSADAQMGSSQSIDNTSKDIIGAIHSVPLIGGILKGVTGLAGNLAVAIQRPFLSTEKTKSLEKRLKYIGVLSNRDKPLDFEQPHELRPNYLGNIALGVEYEPIMPMRLDPTATTVTLPDHLRDETITTTLDIARIYGYKDRFTWRMNDRKNVMLWSSSVWPVPTDVLTGNTNVQGQFAPLEVLSDLYTYYSGSIDYRFDFVATQFHTGMIMIVFIPFNTAEDEEDARSAYYKIFDLREQKSVEFTVPYINNTILRVLPTANMIENQGLGLPSPGTIAVFVQNQLTPIQSVYNSIDVLVYIRAGSDFVYTGLKPKAGFRNRYNLRNRSYGMPPSSNEADSQMSGLDTGDKESIDKTPVFGTVPPQSALIQLMEDHTNIKDIMRRWQGWATFLLRSKRTRFMPVVPMNVTNTEQQTLNIITPTAEILSYFRYYRGSVRLMLEFYPADTEGASPQNQSYDPIDIVHIPQNQWCAWTGTYALSPLRTQFNLGYACNRVLPHINPSIKLEIPFSSVFNYLDLQAGLYNNNYPDLDKIAGNLGLLAITSLKYDWNVFVSWSLGDDATPYKFVGCGQTAIRASHIPESSLLLGLDDQIQVLQNIENIEKTKKNKNIKKQKKKNEEVEVVYADAQMNNGEELFSAPLIVTTAGLPQVNDPIMSQYTTEGPDPITAKPSGFFGATRKRICDSFSSVIKTPFSPFTTRLDRFDEITNKADRMLESIYKIADTITTEIKNKFSWVQNAGNIFSAIVHFLQACMSRTWYGIALGIVGILVNIGLINVSKVDSWINYFKSLFRTSRDHQLEGTPVADSQCDHECRTCIGDCRTDCNYCSRNFSKKDLSTLCSLVFGTVSGFLGVKVGNTKGIASGLFVGLKCFWSTVSVASRFIKDVLDLFFRVYRYYLSRNNDTQLDYAMRANSEDVKTFIDEAQLVLNTTNEMAFETDPLFKYRFWCCAVKALSLQKKFMLNPLPESPAILRLCKDVLELANKHAVQAAACPVRFEPYVLTLSGASKVGKSVLAQMAIPEILSDPQGMNYQSYNPPIYTRVPGNEYWNGFKNQPAILFDDFLACLEPTMAAMQLADLYMLKSTALMNVNMADLSEKKLMCNSVLVWLNRNCPFDVPNGIACKQAFLRRQEHLWEVILKPEYKKIEDVPEDILSRNEHLNFYKYADPADPKSKGTTVYSYASWMTAVKEDFAKYLVREKRMVALRMKRLMLTLPHTAGRMLHEVDPFNIFYSAYTEVLQDSSLSQTGFLPSEVLERQLENLSTQYIALRDERRATQQANLPQTTMRMSNESQPGPSHTADAQFDVMESVWNPMKNLALGIKNSATSLLEHLLFRFDNEIPYFARSRWMDECAVCREENIEMFSTCRNSHGLCQNCWTEVSRMENISCPVCRAPEMNVIIPDFQPHRELRLLLLWNYMSDRGRQFYRRTWNIVTHPYFLIGLSMYTSFTALIGTMTAIHVMEMDRELAALHGLYGFITDGMVLGTSQRELDGTMRHDIQVDGFRVGFNNDQGFRDNVSVAAEWFPEVSLTSTNYTFDPWMGHSEQRRGFARYLGNFGQRHNQEEHYATLFGDAQMDEEEGFETVRLQSRLGRTTHLTACPIKAMRMTSHPSCPHLMLKRDIARARWELDRDNVWKWTGYETDRDGFAILTAFDNPCQYDNCPFKQQKSRLEWLAAWNSAHPFEVYNVLAQFQVETDPWIYPMEFLPIAQCAIVRRKETQLYQQIMQFGQMSWFDWAMTKAKEIWRRFGRIIKLGLAFVTALSTAIAGYNLIKDVFWKEDEQSPEPQIQNSGSFQQRRLKRSNRRTATRIATGQISEMDEVVIKYIQRNTVILVVTFNRNGQQQCNRLRCLGLYGRTAVINKHIAFAIQGWKQAFDDGDIEDFKISYYAFLNRDQCGELEVTHDMFCHGENECSIFNMPKSFAQFKDITNFIATAKEHDSIGSEYQHIECSRELTTVKVVNARIVERVDTLMLRETSLHPQIETFDMYMTNYGVAGACGSVYINSNVSPIFAIHSAGINSNKSSNVGYGCPLVREDILALKDGSAILDYFVPKSSKADAQMTLNGNVMPLFTVTKKQTPYLPNETKIIPSKIQGKIEGIGTHTQPGILSHWDPRWKFEKTPLYWGVTKHTEVPKDFPADAVLAAYEDLKVLILDKVIPLRNHVGVLEMSDACVGFEIPHYEAMKLDTSAGWPWCVGSRKTKNDYVDYERNSQERAISATVDEEVLKVIEMKRGMRKRGIRPLTVFWDCLKDERRKQSKLETPGGTRVFCASPIDFTIDCRAWFLDFMAAFVEARMDAEHCIGISTDGPEWTDLLRRLQAIPGQFADGDFSDFGPRASSVAGYYAFKIIIDWYKYHNGYSAEEEQQAEVMVEELINADHIATNLVYRTFCGLPSGSALTVIQNTLLLGLYFRIAWYEIMVKTRKFTMSDFKRLVRVFGYGDDCIMKIHNSVVEDFNIVTLSEFFKKYTIKFTDASKLGTKKTTELDEIRFLKCGFAKHPYRKGVWLAPLEKLSIEECAQWIWKSRDDTEATLENAEQALRLAYGHGPEYFNDLKNKINAALASEGMTQLGITWQEIDQHFFGDCVIGSLTRVLEPGLLAFSSSRENDQAGLERRGGPYATGLLEQIHGGNLFREGDLGGVELRGGEFEYQRTSRIVVSTRDEEIERREKKRVDYTNDDMLWEYQY